MQVAEPSYTSSHPLLQVAERDLGTALSHGLDLPVTALRVSMEALSREMARYTGKTTIIDGALEEVERLGRNIRDLMDYATPPRPMPLKCSIQEIVHNALRGFDASQREQLFVARIDHHEPIFADAALLTRNLTRLLENAFEAGGDRILLIAQNEEDSASFTIVDNAPKAFDCGTSVDPFRTSKPNHLGLGLTLVQRDVQLMGGTFELCRTPRSNTCARIGVPSRTEEVSRS